MTGAHSLWRPDLLYNQLPSLRPATELETRSVLKHCITARVTLFWRQRARSTMKHVIECCLNKCKRLRQILVKIDRILQPDMQTH